VERNTRKRLITRGLTFGVLYPGFPGITGRGEDNEAASRDSAAKGSITVDPSRVPPPPKSMEGHARNNPGAGGPGTAKGSGYAGSKKK
jgi:hypothetical protein